MAQLNDKIVDACNKEKSIEKMPGPHSGAAWAGIRRGWDLLVRSDFVLRG